MPAASISIDPRVKLLAMIAFITTLSFWPVLSPLRFGFTALVLILISITLGLRIQSLLLRSLVLLPFVGFFALVLALSGDPGRALTVLLKTYLSGFSVIIVASSTSAPDLVYASRSLRVPPFLADVIHLILRYLAVLRQEARSTQIAIAARAGRRGARALLATSGSVAILFVRSLEKADRIFAAMTSRGYSGPLQRRLPRRIRAQDTLALSLAVLALLATLFV